MDDGNPLPSVAIFLLFILLDAIFYGFGAAIQNVNTNDLEHQMEEGSDKARKLLHIVNRPTRFVNTIQVSTNIIGIITGAFILEQLGGRLTLILDRRASMSAPWLSILSLLIVGILLIVLLISFGIVIPKRCAAQNPEKWGYNMLPVVTFFMVPLMPFTWLINAVAFLFLKLIGIDMMSDNENVTEEDIMSMVNEGHEQGVLEAREAEMITNIFELDDKDAGDIMTHRKNLVALDGSMTLKEAVNFILKEGYNSRYPVYEKDIDDITGILHMKDALIAAENKERQLIGIPGLLREASFIPETRSIDTLFKEMQSNKIHMEIVVDEYGQTAGLLTMEDILEEIVGNIMDEYDEEEEFITPLEDGSFSMSGMTPLEDVTAALSIRFSEEDSDTYDTLNGFLISRLDRIPQEHEKPLVEFAGCRFQVTKVGNKMIESVHVSRICGPKSGKGETGKEIKDSDDADRTEHKGDVPG